MPRNMSFSMTCSQVRLREKTVTRRLGWWNLKPGTVINAVEKAMGLKRGEVIKPLCQIRILSCRSEKLIDITEQDVVAEGFPDMTPEQFVNMMVGKFKIPADTVVNRIEFEYL